MTIGSRCPYGGIGPDAGADITGAMFTAAPKRTVLAAVSIALLAAIAVAGPAGGAPSGNPDKVRPTPPGKRVKDTAPPTAPTNVLATSRTTTSIALSWSRSSDNVGVVGYGLYKAGALVTTTSETTAIFSALTCNTNYTLSVNAYDAAGNRSASTSVMVATTACIDATAPSAATTLAASNITQTGLTLTWAASSDNVGVTGYDVYRGATKLVTLTTTTSSQTVLACGTTYTFGVVALDAAGNRSAQTTLGAQTSACSAPTVSGDKFAAPTGSDSNPGTLAAPFLTLRKLASSLAPGQVGMLRGGAYGDTSTYHPVNASGASGQPITITNYPGESVTVKGFLGVDGNFVTIRGLRIDGSNTVLVDPGKCGTQALGIFLAGNDIVFERNEVYQSSLKGSAIYQEGDRNIIRYNKLHDFGACYHYDHGVYVSDADSVQIYGNWIWNNPHGWGVQVYPGPTNARIYNNVIDRAGGGFVISDNGSATSTGNRIYNNVILNSVGMTTQNGYFIAGAGLSGSGPLAGSDNSFTDNAVFNNQVGSVANVAMSGNFATDPTFVDAAGHNYAISSSSPLASWGLWDGG